VYLATSFDRRRASIFLQRFLSQVQPGPHKNT
jgi:hypothetical protein